METPTGTPPIKICGLMRAQDVIACCHLGVHITGFVTEYPAQVPWNLTRDQAERLMENAAGDVKTCVVTGGSRDKILSLAMALHPDYIQLQCHETLADASVIAKALAPEGIRVIKSIPEDPFERMLQFATTDPARCARLLNDTQVAAVLIGSHFKGHPAPGAGHKDSHESGRERKNGRRNGHSPGLTADCGKPTGKKRSTEPLLPEIPDIYGPVREASALPVILAGGITAMNLAEISKRWNPDILDVMTGAEIRPGVKDADLIRKLTGAQHG